MRFDPPDAYWKKDVALFFARRFALGPEDALPAGHDRPRCGERNAGGSTPRPS